MIELISQIININCQIWLKIIKVFFLIKRWNPYANKFKIVKKKEFFWQLKPYMCSIVNWLIFA